MPLGSSRAPLRIASTGPCGSRFGSTIGESSSRMQAETSGTNRAYRRRVTKAGTRGWAISVIWQMSRSAWWFATTRTGCGGGQGARAPDVRAAEAEQARGCPAAITS